MLSRYKDTRPGQTKDLSPLAGEFLNYRRVWLLSFCLTALFALVPVIFFALMDYKLTQASLAQDATDRTDRLASNTWRAVSFFLDERKNALGYVASGPDLANLSRPIHLEGILSRLKANFKGFTDIGVIDGQGTQIAYAGPYGLAGKIYKDQPWFKTTMEQGQAVSEVFLGYRNVPHIAIAIRHRTETGNFFVVRATIEHELPGIFSTLETTHGGDLFLVNGQGILQTPSRYFGRAMGQMDIDLPPKIDKTQTFAFTQGGEAMIAAYRYIPDTPFVLMVLKSQKALMAPWHDAKIKLTNYLALSVAVILVWIGAVTTYLVQRLKAVDRKRAAYCHVAEYANKMATIGRLAAGVAHEINNPLAIINEKAGLIQDMAKFKPEYQNDTHLNGTLNTILESVKRCSRITRQLLSFGRQSKAVPVPLSARQVLEEVLVFLAKEAELRKIEVHIDIPDHLPSVICDHGKLQQIMLNIINNAFSAISAQGSLTVTASVSSDAFVQMDFTDTGCGISQNDMEEIFEPFFSTKTDQGGTGLGLSITYRLVQEMGGRIAVKSQVHCGTTFSIYLPTSNRGESV